MVVKNGNFISILDLKEGNLKIKNIKEATINNLLYKNKVVERISNEAKKCLCCHKIKDNKRKTKLL